MRGRGGRERIYEGEKRQTREYMRGRGGRLENI
jgi:hypothetical protein